MSVGLVGSDADRVEAVQEIANSIESLIKLSDGIFQRLTNRLDSFDQKVSTIDEHINRVSKKVDAIRNLNKSIVLYAPAQFPSNDQPKTFAVFDSIRGLPHHSGNDDVVSVSGNSLHNRLNKSAAIKETIDEKTKFYHVTGSRNRRNFNFGSVIPEYITSVDDLLLFNTSINAYTTDQYVDPLDNTRMKIRSSSRADLNATRKIEAAIADENSTLSVNVKDRDDPLKYEPELGSLQDFDFPDILPDLPGIATDVTFSGVGFAPIAPSAGVAFDQEETDLWNALEPSSRILTRSESLAQSHQSASSWAAAPSQPFTTVPEPKPLDGSNQLMNKVDSELVLNIASENVISIPPPPAPPPPPPPSGPTLSAPVQPTRPSGLEQISKSVVPPEVPTPASFAPLPSGVIPPPPPPPPAPPLPPAAPPPPPPPPSSGPVASQPKKQAAATPSDADDDRTDLMAAIRRAGGMKGAKLRSIKKREEDRAADDVSALPSRNAAATPAVGGGDLMSSLAKALELRRRGISGKTTDTKTTSHRSSTTKIDGALARMSALIPPPPKEEGQIIKRANETDEEWS